MTKKQKKMLLRIFLVVLLAPALFLLPQTGWMGHLRLLLFGVSYLIIGYDIFKKAVRGIIHLQPFDENFLMSVAAVGAVVLGEYAEGLAVMFFYQVGEFFQSYAVGKSRNSIRALMDIRPDTANLMGDDGEATAVSPDEVPVGSLILVRVGEKIPIDGVVAEGCSSLDTSALTGESLPRTVSPGDAILSGCINREGLLVVRTTREFGESTVSKILELTQNAGAKKSRSEQFISRFAKIYTPVVCLSALLLAVLPPLVGMLFLETDGAWREWILRALTFLVISCPCALVISVPLGFFAGIGGAGRLGVLIKGSTYLEALARLDTVAFDKTGTLTEGSFAVREVTPVGMSREALLELAAHAEGYSTHPIAESLRRAYEGDIRLSRVSEVEEPAGRGLCARVDGRAVAVGNARLMEELGVSVPSVEVIGTVVHVAVGGQYAGWILVADQIKPDAAEAMSALRRLGIKRTVLLTGDTEAVGSATAEALGMDAARCGLLPGDKVEALESLMGRGRRVGFVGDGINDAPVLSRADVGIAMGGLGSDAAIEAADVVLMQDHPMQLVRAIRIAKKCMRIVYQNIFFAIGVKLICLILGAFGVTGMLMAIFADVGVMILAVLNAIRTLSVQKL